MKKCSTCKVEKPLSDFYKDKNKKDGHAYVCKICDNSRVRVDNRKGRGKRPDVVEYHKKYHKRHYLKNRELYLFRGYKDQDKNKEQECDLTIEWMKENISNKPCVYCGRYENIGCDRIDNNIGHLKSNVVSCCAVCNTVRNKNFTVAEMVRIGQVIKKIYKERGNK